mgnify:CR=1 FL=1
MANKTEKPTQKKLQDASKKGQILKSRDLTISVIMLVGTLYLGYVFDVHHIMSILEYILAFTDLPGTRRAERPTGQAKQETRKGTAQGNRLQRQAAKENRQFKTKE